MTNERTSHRLTKIPTTVITGFLGSGKTSLIQNLISSANDKQLAFIINEFGDLGVDKELLLGCGIENCSEGDIVELANGCICCTVADDFLPTMRSLLDRPKPPDHIIIETSGLALPKPLLKAFSWPEVRTRATVDGVVAVVDSAAVVNGSFAKDPGAVQLQRESDVSLDHESPLEELFEEQLQCADIIVLNKAELVADSAWEIIENKLAVHRRPSVRSIKASFGRIEASVLLGLGVEAELDLQNRRSLHESSDDHDHEDFDSFVVELGEVLNPNRFEEKLQAVIEDYSILRIKGFLSVRDKPMRLAMQAVGDRVEKYFDRNWGPNESRYSKLVVIGQAGLNKREIMNALSA